MKQPGTRIFYGFLKLSYSLEIPSWDETARNQDILRASKIIILIRNSIMG
jgi:hypothetical protein